jgi:hypothetical protein
MLSLVQGWSAGVKDGRPLVLSLGVGLGCLGAGLLFGGFWFGLVGGWSPRLFVFSVPCMRDVHALCLWDLVPFSPFTGVCSR